MKHGIGVMEKDTNKLWFVESMDLRMGMTLSDNPKDMITWKNIPFWGIRLEMKKAIEILNENETKYIYMEVRI